MRNREALERLASESGRLLGELGVRPEDGRWIRRHAETIASLTESIPARGRFWGLLRRWARRTLKGAS